MSRTMLAALAALALPASARAAPLSPAESAAIDKAVTGVLADTGVPSAEVAVVRDGRIVLNKAWGKASESIAVSRPDLRYQIASNSKQFLAALILLLRDEGKLSLDDKVSRWLPEVTGAKKITLRQLLNHTSGLQDFWPQDYSFAAMEKPVRPQDIVNRWGKKPLDYEPGTRWQYSNTGYVVAGMIAEKAGGKPLWAQFEAKIFRPLGIHPLPIDETNGPSFPQGYHRFALGPVRAATPAAKGWLWAAGELSMTASDLAKWDIARMQRKLLPARDWDEQERPVVLRDGTTNGYGLGIYNTTANGRRKLDHGGESVGFLSQNTLWPDAGVAVVVLTNADFAGAQSDITDKVSAILLPKSAQANTGEASRLDDVRTQIAALTAGMLDPAAYTENARYYFSAETLGDYHEMLSKFGAPTAIEAKRTPRLRGGFVNRVFDLKFGERKMTLITYAEPGEHGRWEQFMLSP